MHPPIPGSKVLVTVVDSNYVNQVALKLMLMSMRHFAEDLIPSTIVLYPDGELPARMLHWLESNRIRSFAYHLPDSADPYRAKFLLARFVTETANGCDHICYIDPDHIVLKDFAPQLDAGTITVSSEIKHLSGLEPGSAPSTILSQLHGIHLNTSLIIGDRRDWAAILDPWSRIYDLLDGMVENRCREELAFSAAAYETGIALKPVAPIFQSNYKTFNPECSLFHYGGDSPEAKSTKSALSNKTSVKQQLSNVLMHSANPILTWAIQKFLMVLYD